MNTSTDSNEEEVITGHAGNLIIVVAILFGNTLTIISIVKDERLRKIGNSFIVSLAVADLLVGVEILVLTIKNLVTKAGWTYSILCVLEDGADVLFCAASVLNIMCISIDRYIAITDPLHYNTRMTRRTAAAMITSAWLLSLITIYVPSTIDWIFITIDQGVSYCEGTQSDITGWIQGIMGFIVPCILILLAYGIIFCIARRQAQQISAQTHRIAQRPDAATQSAQTGRKAAKTLGLITGVFLLCWLPAIFMLIARQSTPVPHIVRNALGWLVYLNSALNPIIYAATNKDFRKAFKKILCRT